MGTALSPLLLPTFNQSLPCSSPRPLSTGSMAAARTRRIGKVEALKVELGRLVIPN